MRRLRDRCGGGGSWSGPAGSASIAANDLVLNVLDASDGRSEDERMALAFKASHVVLVVDAIAAS